MLSEYLCHIGRGQKTANTAVILLKKNPKNAICNMYYVPLTTLDMSKKKTDALFMILATEHHTGSHF